jgi:hypothetical protein
VREGSKRQRQASKNDMVGSRKTPAPFQCSPIRSYPRAFDTTLRNTKEIPMTPIKAIRAKCMDCTGDQPKEIKLCPIEKCPLYPYRFGKRPLRDDLTYPCPACEKKEAPSSPIMTLNATLRVPTLPVPEKYPTPFS